LDVSANDSQNIRLLVNREFAQTRQIPAAKCSERILRSLARACPMAGHGLTNRRSTDWS
jgi:hypothetical protein